MTFAEPVWIIAGSIVSIGTLILQGILQARRQANLEKFAAAHLLAKLTRNVSPTRQRVKMTLFLLSLFCCFLALARPQYGFRWEDTKQKGIDILFAVDTSKSMLAGDVKPNRLERAKYAIMDFVDQLQGDRVGLLPFSGTAFLVCPLTGDYSAFENSLKEVDTSIIPVGGTNIAAAIREAQSVLTNKANYKILILITDGEDLEGDVPAAVEEAAKNGLRIFTVGVGTPEGEIIPVSPGGAQGFVKDEKGNFIVSHLDEAALRQMAEKTDGLYVPLGNKGQGLQTIYEKKLAIVPKEELTERRHKVPLERFGWPLAAAIGFLALEFVMGSRKSPAIRLPFSKKSLSGKGGMGLLIFALAFGLFTLPATASGAGEEKQPDSSNHSLLFDKLNRLRGKHPDDPRNLFNSGVMFYEKKKFDDALSAFNGALKSKDLDLQEKAYYNRGNTYYKKGEETLQSDPQQTREQWEQAVESYSASLKLQPDDRDADFNLKLVRKKIDELKNQENNSKKQENHDRDIKEQKNKKEGQKGKEEQSAKDPGQQQQPGSGQHQPDRDEQKTDEPAPPRKNEPQNQIGRNEKESATDVQALADAERRKQGKMTKEDAEQLLNSLKNEEGKINFLQADGKRKDDNPRRDW